MTVSRSELERQYFLTKALEERRATDPLYTWEPHAKQRDFINSVLGSECYENYALWANRAGKSDVGAYCGARLARFGLPDGDIRPAIGSSTVVWDRATSGWVVALTSKMNRDVIQPKYFDNGFVPAGQSHPPFIPKREIAEWRVSDQILKLKCGSIVGYKSVADGRETFQGAGKDWIHFDEEPSKLIFNEATIRVEAGRRLRVFATCTLLPPEGQVGGVTWMYTEKAKPFLEGRETHCRIFQASIYDNPHLLKEEIALLEAKYPEGSTERRIRLNGELLPGLSGSRAYGAFTYALHVRDTGPLELRRPLCWAIDFNVDFMASLVGQRAGRVFKFHRELILEGGNIQDMTAWFRELYPTHQAELWIYGDQTGSNRSGQTAQSYYDLIRLGLRGYPVPYKIKLPPKNPSQPDRINAMNRALKDEEGEIGMEINPTCVEYIADLEGVLRDKRGGILKTYNSSDSYFARTHASDAAGYWVTYEQPVSSTPLGQKSDRQVSKRYYSVRQPVYGGARG